jgi:hypothetical protein
VFTLSSYRCVDGDAVLTLNDEDEIEQCRKN